MPENRIREFRDRLGLSQTELARRVKIAPQNLSNIERGRLAPWPKVMQALAKALKTTPEDLFPAQAKQRLIRMADNERKVYTLEEWSRLMGCSVASAYNWAKQGKIQGLIRLGERRYCVSKAVTDRILAGEAC